MQNAVFHGNLYSNRIPTIYINIYKIAFVPPAFIMVNIRDHKL